MSASSRTPRIACIPQTVLPASRADRADGESERSVQRTQWFTPEHDALGHHHGVDLARHVAPHDAQSSDVRGDAHAYPAASIRLYTLGAFQVLFDLGQGRTLDLTRAHIWGHGRARDLLLLLLLHRRPLRRQEAAATLWPEADSARRARLLRNALWNLRSALEQHATVRYDVPAGNCARTDALMLRDTPFALSLQVVSSLVPQGACAPISMPAESLGQQWCGFLAFETAASRVREGISVEERITLGQAALQLYGGPFLAHRQNGADTMAESTWILDHRARAQAQWIRLSLELATDLRRVGEREQALDLLMHVVEQDPLQLEAARRAMVLLGDLNRVDEALLVYERCRRSHREAFHRDPSDLKRIATQLRSGHMAKRRELSHTAPPISGAYPRQSRTPNAADSPFPQRSLPSANMPNPAARRVRP